MTTSNICGNCGHAKDRHRIGIFGNEPRCFKCPCKKFQPKKIEQEIGDAIMDGRIMKIMKPQNQAERKDAI